MAHRTYLYVKYELRYSTVRYLQQLGSVLKLECPSDRQKTKINKLFKKFANQRGIMLMQQLDALHTGSHHSHSLYLHIPSPVVPTFPRAISTTSRTTFTTLCDIFSTPSACQLAPRACPVTPRACHPTSRTCTVTKRASPPTTRTCLPTLRLCLSTPHAFHHYKSAKSFPS